MCVVLWLLKRRLSLTCSIGNEFACILGQRQRTEGDDWRVRVNEIKIQHCTKEIATWGYFSYIHAKGGHYDEKVVGIIYNGGFRATKCMPASAV